MKKHTSEDSNQSLTISVEEAAKLAGIGIGTAYKLVRQEVIPHIHAGHRTLIPRTKFLRWLQGGEVERPEPAGQLTHSENEQINPLIVKKGKCSLANRVTVDCPHPNVVGIEKSNMTDVCIKPVVTPANLKTEPTEQHETYLELIMKNDEQGYPHLITGEGSIPVDVILQGLTNFASRHITFKDETA